MGSYLWSCTIVFLINLLLVIIYTHVTLHTSDQRSCPECTYIWAAIVLTLMPKGDRSILMWFACMTWIWLWKSPRQKSFLLFMLSYELVKVNISAIDYFSSISSCFLVCNHTPFTDIYCFTYPSRPLLNAVIFHKQFSSIDYNFKLVFSIKPLGLIFVYYN